jgi:hypothetical protein
VTKSISKRERDGKLEREINLEKPNLQQLCISK